MYGCFDGVIVYGWNQGDREILMKFENDNFETFALDVVRNHLGEAVYGFVCIFNYETGKAEISQEEKMKIDNYFNKMEVDSESNVKLGYYICITGDYETCHTEINDREEE